MAKQATIAGPIVFLGLAVWGGQVRRAGVVFLVGAVPMPVGISLWNVSHERQVWGLLVHSD